MALTADERALRQMMEALGLDRREEVSTPQADAQGRAIRIDESSQDAAVARLQRSQKDGIEKLLHDDKARVLAWNTNTNIEADETITHLQDRWGGQGHRVNLDKGINGGSNDAFHNWVDRKGEERAIYMSEQSGGQRQHSVRQAPQARHRAASPRAQGVVRYVQGQQVAVRGIVKPVQTSTPTIQPAQQSSQSLTARNNPEFVESSIIPASKARQTIQSAATSRPQQTRSTPTSPANAQLLAAQLGTIETVVKDNQKSTNKSRISRGADVSSRTCKVISEAGTQTKDKINAVSGTQDPISSKQETSSVIVAQAMKWLRFVDLKKAEHCSNVAEARDILDNVFSADRGTWLENHRHLVAAWIRYGNLLRTEMMHVAQLGTDSDRGKHFLAEFGFIDNILTHLAAARSAIELAELDELDATVDDQSELQYQPFYRTAKEIHARASSAKAKERQVTNNNAMADGTTTQTSQSDVATTLKEDINHEKGISNEAKHIILSATNFVQPGSSPAKVLQHDTTRQTITEDATTDSSQSQSSTSGNSTVVADVQLAQVVGNVNQATPRSYIEDNLIELIEANSRLMTARSGMMIDGVVKRRGVFFLA